MAFKIQARAALSRVRRLAKVCSNLRQTSVVPWCWNLGWDVGKSVTRALKCILRCDLSVKCEREPLCEVPDFLEMSWYYYTGTL